MEVGSITSAALSIPHPRQILERGCCFMSCIFVSYWDHLPPRTHSGLDEEGGKEVTWLMNC